MKCTLTVAVVLLLSGLHLSSADQPPAIVIDRQLGQIRLTATVARQGIYPELRGAIEYLACGPDGKTYEALFICPAKPAALYQSLIGSGWQTGTPAGTDQGMYRPPTGERLRISVAWREDETAKRVPVESLILDRETGAPMPPVEWVFTGSRVTLDPATGREVLQASLTNNLIALHHRDPSVLIQNPLRQGGEPLRYKPDLARLPPAGTPVGLIIEAVIPPPAKRAVDESRLQAIITGRVQGVGFRAFTQRQARAAGLRGWVRNLTDGSVEVVAAGRDLALEQFRTTLRNGPRGAVVEDIREGKIPAGELPGPFEIRATAAPD